MKKIGIYIALFILTLTITNSPTLAKYVQKFEPISETIIAYDELDKINVEVQHIDVDTNKILQIDKLENIEENTILISSNYKINIPYYKYNKSQYETITINKENNIIKLFYNEDLKAKVTINYIDIDSKGSETPIYIQESKIINQYIDSEIVSTDYIVDINDYVYVESSADKLTVSEKTENIINLYYEKIDEYRDVEINYYSSLTKEKIIPSNIIKKKINTTVQSEEFYKIIEGYELDFYEIESIIVGEEANIINIYYKETLSTEKINVELVYLDVETKEEVSKKEVIESVEIGSVLNYKEYIKKIEGYDYNSCSIENLEVSKENNKIEYYYKKEELQKDIYNVNLNYYNIENNEKIGQELVLENIEKGSIINSQDYIQNINGYEFVKTDKEKLVVDQDNTIINYYYNEIKEVINYATINIYHLDKKTNEEILEKTILPQIKFDEYIVSTDYVAEVQGYKFVESDIELLKVEKENHDIKLYYRKDEVVKPPTSEDNNGDDNDSTLPPTSEDNDGDDNDSTLPPTSEDNDGDNDDSTSPPTSEDNNGDNDDSSLPQTSDNFKLYPLIGLMSLSVIILYINNKK